MNKFRANQKLLFSAETIFNLRPLEKYEILFSFLNTSLRGTENSIFQKVRDSLVSKLIELKEIKGTYHLIILLAFISIV